MSEPLRVLVTYGTRPEIIKLAPVIAKLDETPGVEARVVATGQHRELARLAEETFGLVPDEDLGLMRDGQAPEEIHRRVLESLYAGLGSSPADLVVVQGDTTSALAAAQAAFYRRIPSAHVEAGLRSHRRYAPFPEEMNRRLISMLASIHFVPTRAALANLPAQVVGDGRTFVTGNPVLDSLGLVLAGRGPTSIREELGSPGEGRLLLATVHRRESWGEAMESIAAALADILDRHELAHLALPLHPNPAVGDTFRRILGSHPRAHLLEPLSYPELVALLAISHLVLTDSGGLQEEAPALDKPVIVLRNETDRPEAIEAGTAVLGTTRRETILAEASRLLDSSREYERMAASPNPYGDGRASARIVQAILHVFERGDPPPPFEP